ncbi:MAG: FAD-dependent oxidoreductase [Candidatus Neomarinimicrobiota bacterium]
MPESATRRPDYFLREDGYISFSGDRHKYRFGPVEQSPCATACPAGVNVKAYVSLIAAGKFVAALDVIRQRNPLPGICGRVCTHPCEAACNRNAVDQPVAVRWLKRFAADYELAHPGTPPVKIETTRPEKVAVVGSGPSGLTAANDLVRQGFDVTVFETLPEPGGMLIAGIPAYRLPRNILAAEIDYLINLGIKIKTGHPIEGETAIDDLFSVGYSAIYLAIGAHRGKKLNIAGEENYRGVLDAVAFLNQVNFTAAKKPGDQVIVIGGGNSAIDSARTARRLGSREVHIVYRRTRNEMPADEEEINEAEHEGVQIHYLAAPLEIVGIDGRVNGMKCQKMTLGEPDESGRRRPVPVAESEFFIAADCIIPAISQEPEIGFGLSAVRLSRWNTLVADEITMVTDRPGVFAGGDAVTGPGTVIDAIAHGHRAADAIAHYLTGESLVPPKLPQLMVEAEIKIDPNQRPQKTRAEMPALNVQQRLDNFEEVEFGFDEATAIAEARRCLRCGPCGECAECVSLCDKQPALLTIPDQSIEILCRVPNNLRTILNDQSTLPATLRFGKTGKTAINLRSLQPRTAANICRGCGECVSVCGYGALELLPTSGELKISQLNPDLCRACGICVAACPNGAMLPAFIDEAWLDSKLAQMKTGQTNLVVFSCRWNGSSLHGDELAQLHTDGVNLHLIQTICGGRIEPGFVLKALAAGASGVLLTACSDESCHYGDGARRIRSAFDEIRNLVHILGTAPSRIGFAAITDGDSVRFIQAVSEFARSISNQMRN